MFKSIARLPTLRSSTSLFASSKPSVSFKLYHSYDHPDEPLLKPDTPHYQILDRALSDFVPTLGFQHKAILESSRTFGFSDAVQSLFENGTMDLIKFHLVRERIALKQYLESEEFQKLNEQGKLKYLVAKRLLANAPFAQHLNQLQTYLILPPNIADASQELHQLSDDIRFYSGDKTNDFAWYTKRLSLSSTYVALELFMANDKSKGFQNTLELAEKRLDNLDSLGQVYTNAEEFFFYTVNSGINLFKSQATRG